MVLVGQIAIRRPLLHRSAQTNISLSYPQHRSWLFLMESAEFVYFPFSAISSFLTKIVFTHCDLRFHLLQGFPKDQSADCVCLHAVSDVLLFQVCPFSATHSYRRSATFLLAICKRVASVSLAPNLAWHHLVFGFRHREQAPLRIEALNVTQRKLIPVVASSKKPNQVSLTKKCTFFQHFSAVRSAIPL